VELVVVELPLVLLVVEPPVVELPLVLLVPPVVVLVPPVVVLVVLPLVEELPPLVDDVELELVPLPPELEPLEFPPPDEESVEPTWSVRLASALLMLAAMLLPKASDAAPRPTPTTATISAYSAADAPRVSFNNRLIMSLPATHRGTRSEGIELNIESIVRKAGAGKVAIWDVRRCEDLGEPDRYSTASGTTLRGLRGRAGERAGR
jgi:hypothetical protein